MQQVEVMRRRKKHGSRQAPLAQHASLSADHLTVVRTATQLSWLQLHGPDKLCVHNRQLLTLMTWARVLSQLSCKTALSRKMVQVSLQAKCHEV